MASGCPFLAGALGNSPTNVIDVPAKHWTPPPLSEPSSVSDCGRMGGGRHALSPASPTGRPPAALCAALVPTRSTRFLLLRRCLQCTAEEYEAIARELAELARSGEGFPKFFRLGFHVSGHYSAQSRDGGPNGGWQQ